MKSLIIWCIVLPAVLARTPEHMIVGGQDADEGEWPWQLSLRYAGSHSCGASLITSRAAVTTAHCVGQTPINYQLLAGTNQRTCIDEAVCPTRQPNNIVRHPDYTGSQLLGYPNDVAVIGFYPPLDAIPGKIEYITMAVTDDQLGQECYITGWGLLSGGGSMPVSLQETQIDILALQECWNWYSSTVVRPSQLCIQDITTQTRNACGGDEGGPLVCRNSTDLPWELVGAISWGSDEQCEARIPYVCTRISSFRDWILTQVP